MDAVCLQSQQPLQTQLGWIHYGLDHRKSMWLSQQENPAPELQIAGINPGSSYPAMLPSFSHYSDGLKVRTYFGKKKRTSYIWPGSYSKS